MGQGVPRSEIVKYYLVSVVFALLMGGLCVLLQPHPFPHPGIAVMSLS